MRGPIRRGGARRAEDGTYREEMAAQRQAEVEREKKTVRVNEFITVSELAQILKLPATEIVGFAFKNLGLMVTINQRLDFDQIELIAGEFGFQAVREGRVPGRRLAHDGVADTPESSSSRARRSSRSWVTSTTARRRCSTTSARRTSSRARPAASRSTSARTT